MRLLVEKLSLVGALLLGLLLLSAQAPMLPGFPPGAFQARGALTPGGAAAYQGPGDAQAQAFFTWGSVARSYSAAYATGSNGAADLVDTATGLTTYTMKILATGFADAAGAVASMACTPACSITKIYDQTGNGRHWTQGTLANMPALSFNKINGLPGVACVGGTTVLLATATVTIAQTFSGSAVFESTNGSTGGGAIGADAGVNIGIGHGATNNVRIGAGTNVDKTGNDNAFHAVSGVFAGASSAMNVDGADFTALNAGTNAFSGNAIRICRALGLSLTGFFEEGGLVAGTLGSTDRANLYTNQHGINGYNGGV